MKTFVVGFIFDISAELHLHRIEAEDKAAALRLCLINYYDIPPKAKDAEGIIVEVCNGDAIIAAIEV